MGSRLAGSTIMSRKVSRPPSKTASSSERGPHSLAPALGTTRAISCAITNECSGLRA